MTRFAAVLALAVLAACQPDDPQGRSAGDLAREEKACRARGGSFEEAGLFGKACIVQTRDAGALCRKAEDCESLCILEDPAAETGQCAPRSPMIGCYGILGPEGERTDICQD